MEVHKRLIRDRLDDPDERPNAHPQSITSAVTIHATFPVGTKRQAIADWIAVAPGAQRITKLPSTEGSDA